MALAHLVEQLTCRLYNLKFRGLNLRQDSGKNSEQVAVAHLIEQLTCRLYGLKLRGLNLLHSCRKMDKKFRANGRSSFARVVHL
jgi:hypothetical protein